MKPNLLLLSAVLFTTAAYAQTTGVSHPEDIQDTITTAAPKPVKPSPAVQMPTPAPVLRVHAVDPATAPSGPTPAEAPLQVAVTHAPVITDDINSGIVSEVYSPENELPEGTLLRVSIDADISTATAQRGQAFHAQLLQPIERHGKVILPEGTMLHGRITQVHGGHRIGGPASIHLEPEFVTLPDGVTYKVNAQVIDLGRAVDSKVSAEGTIQGDSHPRATLAALGLTTASSAAAGAMVAGVPGAVVGGAIGAGVGTVWWLKRDNQETLAQGSEIIFSLNRPMLLQDVKN
jgi:hypothetical protein